MKTVVRKIAVVMALVLMGAVLTAVAHGQCATLGRSGAILHQQSWQLGEHNSGSFLLASEQSDDDPIVGMWHVKFTAEGNTGPGGPPDGTPIDNAIVQWHPDRTEIMNSGRPAQDELLYGSLGKDRKVQLQAQSLCFGQRYRERTEWNR